MSVAAGRLEICDSLLSGAEPKPSIEPNFTVTFGVYDQTLPWADVRPLTWTQLSTVLTNHVTGRKAGSCFVPARFSGTQRRQTDAVQIDIAVLDSDSGATLGQIESALKRCGWAGIISSTHSHLTTCTTARRSAWDGFADAHPDPVAAPAQFLSTQRGYAGAVCFGAKISEMTDETVVISHQGCPKFRVVVPLQTPWRAANYLTQEAANAGWRECITNLAAALDLDHDQACTDTSRLFYLPRRRTDDAPVEMAICEGGFCDIFAIETASTSSNPTQSRLGVDRVRKTDTVRAHDYVDPTTGEVFDLVQWSRLYAEKFEIVQALLSRRPELFVGLPAKDGKHYIRCANRDAHSQAEADAATIVINASQSRNLGFTYHCLHAHCTGVDRLVFVRKMLEQDWLTTDDLTNVRFQCDRVASPPIGPLNPKRVTGDALAGLLTEHSVADQFSLRYANDPRYCHDTGAWFQWCESRWQQNRTKLAFNWARKLAAELSASQANKVQVITGKAAFAGSVERFAEADETFACTAAKWNVDPYMLGTPLGTVNLRTGELRQARRGDYITKVTAAGPEVSATCPRWCQFLEETTGNDEQLIAFLKQWCGYMLTGDTSEHALLFLFGTGGNGKSVFLNTIIGIMGDYCRIAPMDTFTLAAGDRHPTDIAMMHGARVVCATETEEGRAWAESRIKQLTGGDKVAARFMRRDFFEYVPQFKLVFAGNHKPVLRNVDEGTRRRFNIVPFTMKPAAPDRELERKLRAEWPGILRWMIEGRLEWQRSGLVRPPAVTEATEDYFDAQDMFGRWVSERCVLSPENMSKPGVLSANCRQWAEASGELPLTPSQFRSAMERFDGVRYVKIRGVHWVKGLSLNLNPPTEGERGREGEGV
jgi:putative DNA primase/helicase